MTPTELDLPLTPSAEQIRRREFATIRRGYDPDQVKAYLGQIADQIETLEEQARVAKLEVSVTGVPATAEAEGRAPEIPGPETAVPGAEPAAPDPYVVLSERLADLMRVAEQHAEETRQEAAEEARRVIEEAQQEADSIRLDAQSKAESVRQEAGELLHKSSAEAEKMVSGLASRRESLLSELERMRQRLLGVAESLDAIASEPSKVIMPAAATSLPVSQLFDPAAAATSGPVASGSAIPAGADLFADPEFADLWDPPGGSGGTASRADLEDGTES